MRTAQPFSADGMYAASALRGGAPMTKGRRAWTASALALVAAACGTSSLAPSSTTPPPTSDVDSGAPRAVDASDASSGRKDAGVAPPPSDAGATDASSAIDASDASIDEDAGPPPTAAQAIAHLGPGINVGNSFDAPGGETAWGNPEIQEYYFDDFVAAGIQAVRIPVTWDQHVAASAPYAIDAAFLARVEQVLDWALARGLYVLVDAHHEDWLKTNPTADNLARFTAIWTQLAARFQSKSYRLLFEILNEPHAMTVADIDALNANILGVIRKTNPKRIVVYAGTDYSGPSFLEQAKVPAKGDRYVIANFHAYDPWSFVSGGPDVTWGTQADKDALAQEFDGVAQYAATNGIPAMIDELGAGPNHDKPSRLAFYEAHVADARSRGMGYFAWDDNGGFQVYVRQAPANHAPGGAWNDATIRDALTK
jgi:hypothetical protein